MTACWTALLYLTLWVGPIASGQSIHKIFTIDDHFVATTLVRHLDLFSDSTCHVTITDILNDSTNQYAFGSVKDEILNLGYDPRAHWMKCQLKNAGRKTQNLVFGLDFFDIDSLSFYIVDSTNTILYRQNYLSRKTPIADRPIAVRYFAFPVVIKPNQSLTLYCRVFRRSSMLLLPFKLFTKRAFLENGFSFDFLFLLGIGILLIAFLTSLSLYVATKKFVLLYYSGYALCYCVALLSFEGIWSQYTTISFLDENTKLVMAGMAGFFQINFTLEFLQMSVLLAKRYVVGIRLIALLSLLFGLYVMVAPFSYTSALLISGIGIINLITIMTLLIVGLTTRQYESILYLIGFLPFFIVVLWLAGNVLAIFPRNWQFYQLAYACPFAQLVVLGVGLGFKLIREQEQSVVAVVKLKQQQIEAIIQTQESERQRIAADLHDDLGGTLATLRRRLIDLRVYFHEPESLLEFDKIQPLIQKSSNDLRRISHNLMPPEFARIGLSSALEQLVRSQPLQSTRYTFITSGIERKLPLDIELNSYRIVSELIQNIGKHAQAKQASVQLLYYDSQLVILVEDDGVGSRAALLTNEPIGIGLKNCSLRAEYIGATLWRDATEAGTLVVLTVPYLSMPNAAQITQPNSTD